MHKALGLGIFFVFHMSFSPWRCEGGKGVCLARWAFFVFYGLSFSSLGRFLALVAGVEARGTLGVLFIHVSFAFGGKGGGSVG